ncbi:MAG: ribbon-helix-helix protein, CopG family [Candidatus Syntrophoarchaeum sp.]|nr:ribbon-helix-helix protein, CopG family [Candidatus Syntrophoarchaeum sp.]
MEPINIRLPEKKLEKIDEIASKNGITRSEVVRQALTIYLSLLENIGDFSGIRGLKINSREISATRRRDLLLLHLKNRQVIALGSTSSGGIGEKAGDKLQIDGRILGKIMARTALIKVIAVGASPITLVGNLSVELNPSGLAIFGGIREESRKIKRIEILEGHTEENFSTNETGLGITVLGIVEEERLKVGKIKAGDCVIAVGNPKVGREVLEEGVIELETVLGLSKSERIHELLPVGSGGIRREIEELEKIYGIRISLKDNPRIAIDRSCGPSSVLLAMVAEEDLDRVLDGIKEEVEVIGEVL